MHPNPAQPHHTQCTRNPQPLQCTHNEYKRYNTCHIHMQQAELEQRPQDPRGRWIVLTNKAGRMYYYNKALNESQ